MKRLILTILILMLAIPCYSADEWDKSDPAGTSNVSDLDTNITANNNALDRLVSNYREGAKLKYNSVATVDITAGEVTCSNTAGTLRRFRSNTSTLNVTWADIDAGAESNATYYIFALADADATTFTASISLSSTTPTGATYYARLGSFVNSGGDIQDVTNDNDTVLLGSGTVANGGTISLPSGFAQDECKWTVALGVVDPSESEARGLDNLTFTVTSSRVVTATWATKNWVDSGSSHSGTGTANFVIICHR